MIKLIIRSRGKQGLKSPCQISITKHVQQKGRWHYS